MSSNNIRILSEQITYQELKSISKNILITGIYKIENTVNHKVYIGKSKNIIRRLNEHVIESSNNHLRSSFEKYGLDKFSFEVIKQTYDLDYWEIFLIQIYRATDDRYGYNVATGGEGGNLGEKWYNLVWDACHNDEYSQKISKALLGHYTSDERKQKISNSIKRLYEDPEYKKKCSESHQGLHWYTNGVKNTQSRECPKGYRPGRTINYIVSEETKKKQSIIRKGRKFSQEHRQHMSESFKGRVVSEKTKLKISNTLKLKNQSK